MPPPEIITPRLRLRAWRESDFEPHIRWEADPRVTEFLPWPGRPVTDDDARQQVSRSLNITAEEIRKWVHAMAVKPDPWWAVEAPGVADVIGAVGLGVHTFKSDFTPCTEIGWRLAHDYWGKGYATEAARAVLSYAFDTIGMDELFSTSTLRNKRSFALMKRIGLRYVKDFQWPLLPEDHPNRPYALYKITCAEWMARKAA